MTQSMFDQIERSRGWLVILSDGSRYSGKVLMRFSPRQEAKARREETVSTKVRRETYGEAAMRFGIRLN